MSTDLEFATVTFPTVRDDRHRRAAQAASASGFAAGYAEGLRAAADAAQVERQERDQRDAEHLVAQHQRLTSALGALARATTELQCRSIDTADATADRLLDLAVDLAEAVVGRRLGDAREFAAAAVDRALAAADRAEIVAVRLHPDDLRTLVGTDSSAATTTRLIADGDLDRGDAVVEVEHGWIDARISTAFERARSIIAEGS